MKTVRRGVFETNRSSTHSLTIAPLEDYESFREGKMWYYEGKLISKDEIISMMENQSEDDFEKYRRDNYIMNYDEYSYKEMDFESYYSKYVSKSGDVIVVFGYYGQDN